MTSLPIETLVPATIRHCGCQAELAGGELRAQPGSVRRGVPSRPSRPVGWHPPLHHYDHRGGVLSDERQIVQLSLAPGRLQELLNFPLACRFGLAHDDSDPSDTYRLSAAVPSKGDSGTEGILRYLSELADAKLQGERYPPLPEPSPEVAEELRRWRYWFSRRDELRDKEQA